MSIKQLREMADRVWHDAVDAFDAEARDRGFAENPDTARALAVAVEQDSLALRTLLLTPLLRAATARLGDVGLAKGEVVNELATYFWFLLRWRAAQYPVFALSESLAASLLLTDCSNLPAEDWALPFDPTVIKLPAPSPLKIVDGPIVRESSIVLVGSLTIFTEAGAARAGLRVRGRQSMLDLMNDVAKHEDDAERHTILRILPDQSAGHSASAWERAVPPAEGDTFQSWLERSGSLLVENPEDLLEAEDHASLATAWRIAMGLWQYLDDLAAEPRAAACERFRPYQEGKVRTYRVGKEIKLEAPSGVLRSIGTAGWKVHSRFMVRGHHRNQPVGEGRSGRKRIWVRPFYKGPATAQDVLDRTYKVE